MDQFTEETKNEFDELELHSLGIVGAYLKVNELLHILEHPSFIGKYVEQLHDIKERLISSQTLMQKILESENVTIVQTETKKPIWQA